MNTKLVLKLNGYILLFDVFAMVLPLIVAGIYKESTGMAFLPVMLLCLAVAIPLIRIKPQKRDLFAREGLVTVALAWIIMSFVGGLPFFFSREIPNLIDCFFESASGFTTTGATILTDIEAMSKCMLFWRSFTHWIGGMGVLMFVLAIAPLAGGNNMQLIRAESPGPQVEKLLPKANSTAKVLYGMYIGLTVLQVIFLMFGNMPLFDALTTAFGTAGTGGFAIKSSSMGGYSQYTQIVVTVFMLLFSVNFNIYFFIIAKKFSSIWKNEELRAFAIIVFASIALITLNTVQLFENLGGAIHHSSFAVATIISTSGFSTVDFNTWPDFSKTLLVVLMFIGACAGSTGGGIKVSRILIMFKSLKREFFVLIHPRSVKTIRISGKKIDDETVKKVNSYMICYILLFFISFLIISFDNFGFETNFTAVAATLNNIGPGLGAVGPAGNFAAFSPLSKIVFAIDMICGRLELFPILILFLPHTWKKY
ncbi:MAG: TrkH family potassium uptake protein [Ruminococcaceae bacterium]|nr:TrkH family potassium uptake protein [Oscillospiraceae bacterium]MBQ7119666.1 TrkH family potassium uptake protein [Oscillospiraceae bacterium]